MTQDKEMQLSLEHIQEIVLFFGEDGMIFYANMSARELLEYGDQIFQSSIYEVLPGIFGVESHIENLMQEMRGGSKATEAYRLNRTCFPVDVRFFEFEFGQYACIASDMTEEAYLQRKIEQVQQEADMALKVKSEFVANITHELRTPVNGILGNILELKDGETDARKLRVLNLVERGCADMNAIINNILDFSKLEAGKFTLEKREFEFRSMLEYVESNHRPKATEKGLEFSVSIAPGIPEKIIGDELRIVQILNNLLSNAFKFTSVGRVALEVVKTSQLANRMELFFLVIDTGIGIKKEDQDKLFQSFSQVDASISRKFGGTGLGLNICKQLVELMDGSIHVESTSGQGSMFSFQIWVDVPEEFITEEKDVTPGGYTPGAYKPSFSDYTKAAEMEELRTYGTEKNLDEISRNLNKLILSVEMENWEKAEGFSNTLRELTENAPKEIKNLILRSKMAVQKEDYEKTADAVDKLRDLLEKQGDD